MFNMFTVHTKCQIPSLVYHTNNSTNTPADTTDDDDDDDTKEISITSPNLGRTIYRAPTCSSTHYGTTIATTRGGYGSTEYTSGSSVAILDNLGSRSSCCTITIIDDASIRYFHHRHHLGGTALFIPCQLFIKIPKGFTSRSQGQEYVAAATAAAGYCIHFE